MIRAVFPALPVRRILGRLLSLAILTTALFPSAATLRADDHADRAIKTRVNPVYPELAKRMHISGMVRISATVAPDGTVTATKTVSGNHMLSPAAEDAVHRWKFAPAAEESTVEVNIDFKGAE
jgi:TonB family protein